MLRRTFIASSLQGLAAGRLLGQDASSNERTGLKADTASKGNPAPKDDPFKGVPELKCEVKGIGGTEKFFSVTADGKLMAVHRKEKVPGPGGKDTVILVHETLTQKEVAKFRYAIAPKAPLSCLAISADGKYVVSGRAEPGLALWDVTTGKRLEDLPSQEKALDCAAFSHDGKTIVAGTRQGVIQAWDFPKCETRFYLQTNTGFINSINFSADDRRLAVSGSSAGFYILDLQTEKSIAETRDFSQVNGRSSLSPDGKTLALVSSTTGPYLRDVDRGGVTYELKEAWRVSYDIAISPDGQIVVVPVGQLQFGFYQTSSGKLIATFRVAGTRTNIHHFKFIAANYSLVCKRSDGGLFYFDPTLELSKITQLTTEKKQL